MPSLILLLAIAAAPGLAREPADALPSAASDPGRDRIVCRHAIQTATRMRQRRACRLESEWRMTRDGRAVDDRVAEDADTLTNAGESLITHDLGGNNRIPR